MTMLAATAGKIAFLVIMGCSGSPDQYDGTQCDAEDRPESWTNSSYMLAKEECEAFIHAESFDPSDYMPNQDFYAVRCE